MDVPLFPSGSAFNYNKFNGNRIRSYLVDEEKNLKLLIMFL